MGEVIRFIPEAERERIRPIREACAEVIRFIPKAERERIRLIREARAIYESVFAPAPPVSENNKARVSHTIGGTNADRSDGVLS
jgi:hypothetical protein